MTQDQPLGKLREISPDRIRQNPDNPRLFFRVEETETLLQSIRRFGVQVPITVFQDGSTFTLIDGERRWRCAKKLNLQHIPAIVQPKPTPLENLLLMFNIHALREQWDYLTIANKLPDVMARFEDEQGRKPNEIELSDATGLTRGQIRRCRLLLELPQEFRDLLLKELDLPKTEQRLSEDFFIEMERALRAVRNRLPGAITDTDDVRHALISKFRDGIISNVTDFRKLSKIATSVKNVGVKKEQAEAAVRKVFEPANQVGIETVFAGQFELHYDIRRVKLSIAGLAEFIEGKLEVGELLQDKDLIGDLHRLRDLIDRMLEA